MKSLSSLPPSTFVVTGGHHNSALVVAEELRARGHKVHWIGHRQASHGDQNDSAEYLEVKAAGFPFHDLRAGKSAFSLQSLFRLPLGLYLSYRLLRQIQPAAVISFGGYLGFAVCQMAFLLNIPFFLHEQTVVAGKANLWLSRFARWIYLTWDSSQMFYPAKKVSVVGLPVRQSFLQPKLVKLFPRTSKPTLLVICGKLGSHKINRLIFRHLPDLLMQFNLIHATGTNSTTGDYDHALTLANALPPDLARAYSVHGYILGTELADILHSVDLVLGRSGAHITYELALLKKNSVLIPFLGTYRQEQLRNARLLASRGLAVILPETSLSYPHLLQAIKKGLSLPPSPLFSVPSDSASRLLDDLLTKIR